MGMKHFGRYWLFVNMLYTKEDKILITNMLKLKGYNKGI